MSSSTPPHQDSLVHKNQLHSSYSNKLFRTWQNKSNGHHHASDFILPLFILNERNVEQPITSLPGVSQHGFESVIDYITPLHAIGLRSVLLFPVMNSKGLDKATSIDHNPVLKLIPSLKQHFPSLTVIVDVCLCAFKDDGHCCVFFEDGSIDDQSSVKEISELAFAYAHAGADMVAPSDMNDGRILGIKKRLRADNLQRVPVMSYSCKFASCLYGPFRDAARSAPKMGTDRSCYQLPYGSSALSVRAAIRDAEEGADFLMVKPGLFYLDVIRQIADQLPHLPMAVYQVSGEYSMLVNGAATGIFDLRKVVLESTTAFKRAGAQMIITYFTPQILAWLQENQFEFEN